MEDLIRRGDASLECEDAISREWLLKFFAEDEGKDRHTPIDSLIALIKDAPSVAPSRPSGENIGTDYAECDQFICSECGTHLQGWVRIDEDDYDDGIVHEYEFRFCPNCGAKMVKESE